MKIVTWNLRYIWKERDGVNSFVHRAGLIYEKIIAETPDILAFQEVTEKSRDYLIKLFPEYEFFGTLRSENYEGEGLYTAFRKDTFTLMSGDIFWLSPTPHKAGSRFANQSINPRICVVSKLRDIKTNEIFRVYNVHLDDLSDEARQIGLNAVLKTIDQNNADEKLPVVLLGDFNAKPDSNTVQLASFRGDLVDVTTAFETTFHGFGTRNEKEKIDYIFLDKQWESRVLKTELWTDCCAGIYLSDHYPICTIIK